jgi:hypothetical protein
MILLIIGFALCVVVGSMSWLAAAVWLEAQRKNASIDQGLDSQDAGEGVFTAPGKSGPALH